MQIRKIYDITQHPRETSDYVIENIGFITKPAHEYDYNKPLNLKKISHSDRALNLTTTPLPLDLSHKNQGKFNLYLHKSK